MRKINEFSTRDALHYILSSKVLSRRFDEYIYEGEMDYITDKLSCFPSGSIDYCVGVYEPSSIKVCNASDFLDGVLKCTGSFGCTEKLNALINQCYALKYKNLFAFMVNKLAKMFFDEEIKPTIDFLEQCSYAIHSKDANDNLLAFVELFVDCHCDNVFIDDNNELIEMVKL